MKRHIIVAATAFLLAADAVQGQKIVSAVGATINSGGAGFGSIANTYNKAGLLTGYTSGVTDFDSYLAGNPKHNYVYEGNEWFSNEGTTSASVTYDLGSAMQINKLALWNDEAAGIGLLSLFGSIDGVTFSLLSSGLTPTNNPNDQNYGADVFGFSSMNMRYMRLDMSSCPQSGQIFNSCSIGEVAFRTASTTVPEPSTVGMLSLGMIGLVVAARRRKAT
jgi:hypothetical protein